MHDIAVLSDLHIGRGKNPATGRYHTLETFFYDEDLRQFCRHLCAEVRERGVPLLLVFNGDAFDFLRLDADCEAGASRREQRFGADLSPEVSAGVVREILAGHPIFVEALADVLQAGNRVLFLPGNHDIEIAFEPVQAEIRRRVLLALAGRVAEPEAQTAVQRLEFGAWFHHEPGRIWIEHGCQYDAECSFRYPLRGGLSKGLEDPKVLELDMPLGNFFQKYLYNAFGPLTFIVPSTRANGRYMRWLLIHEPRLLFSVIASHAPFIVQVLRRVAKKGGTGRETLKEAHRAGLEELAKQSGLGEDLHRVDALKQVGNDLTQAAREYGLQGLRFTLAATGVSLVGAGLWATGFAAISELQSGVGLKALAFLALNFLAMASVAGAATYTLFRGEPPGPQSPLRAGADALASIVDVPIVTFGHTHDEMIWPLVRAGGGRAWYFNTGTWIAVFTHDVLMPRERVQLTYLRVRGDEAELLHWSPGRREALPVILLDEFAPNLALTPVATVEPAS